MCQIFASPYVSLCLPQHPHHPGLSSSRSQAACDKLSDIKTASSRWIHRSQCSKSDLLSLIGTLSFATKVVHAGRTFLRRMIDLSTTVPHRRDIILLNEGFRLDLQWWTAFTTPWSGRSFFLLPHWTPAPDLHLYTDSFSEIGFGAYLNGEWFHGRWPPDQLHYSIQYKELYPIVVAAQVWGRRWTTLKVRFHCDNQAIVACLTSGSSHCPHIMHLLRNLFLLSASNNNAIADSLSRFQMVEFRHLAPQAAPHATPIPPSLPLQLI